MPQELRIGARSRHPRGRGRRRSPLLRDTGPSFLHGQGEREYALEILHPSGTPEPKHQDLSAALLKHAAHLLAGAGLHGAAPPGRERVMRGRNSVSASGSVHVSSVHPGRDVTAALQLFPIRIFRIAALGVARANGYVELPSRRKIILFHDDQRLGLSRQSGRLLCGEGFSVEDDSDRGHERIVLFTGRCFN